MIRYPTLTGLRPTHPGEILREDVLPTIGLSKSEIARRLGIPRSTLNAVLAERRRVTPILALRLGKFLNSPPRVWTTLQANYDVAILEYIMSDDLAAIETIKANAA